MRVSVRSFAAAALAVALTTSCDAPTGAPSRQVQIDVAADAIDLPPAAPTLVGLVAAITQPANPVVPGTIVDLKTGLRNTDVVTSLPSSFTLSIPKYVATSLTVGPGVTCTGSSNASTKWWTCATPALAPGAAAGVRLRVTAPTPAGVSRITFAATIAGPINSAYATFDVHYTGPANLLVSYLTVTPSTILTGGAVTVSATIFNGGWTDLANADATVALPAGSVVTSVSATNGYNCTAVTTTVSCTGAPFPLGGQQSVTIGMKAPASPGALPVTATADPANQVPESNEGDNARTTTLTVVSGQPSLSVSSTPSPDPVAAGAILTRTLVVTNNGGAPADSVTLSDYFWTFAYHSWSSPDGFNCSTVYRYGGRPPKIIGTRGIKCVGGTLAPGASASVAVQIPIPSTTSAGTYSDTVVATTTTPQVPGTISSAIGHTTVFLSPQPVPPVNLTVPVLSGVLASGSTVTTTNGTWAGTTPMTFSYAWQHCDAGGASCTPIAGASAQSYVLADADVGGTVRAEVTASNGAPSTATATSAPSGVIVAAAAPSNTVLPTISGLDFQVGVLLTVSTGTWTGTPPITFTYQWERCDDAGTNCAAIAGATNAYYVPVTADANQRLQVRVTATNYVGSAFAYTSLTDNIDP